MLKVVALNGSNRKMNTFKLVSEVKNILKEENIEVEIINLYDYEIMDCLGCEVCINKDFCVLGDDVEKIMQKIKLSDGVILASPVYLQGVSGKLKTFIDRTCKWFHRPEIFGKPILVMATTKGSGLKDTLKYLDKVVIQWGGINGGRIGRDIRSIENRVTRKECEKFIDLLTLSKESYKPSMSSLINYQVQKALSFKMGNMDELYWREKGWQNEIYYFKCKINPFKKLISWSFFNILHNAMNKKSK